MQAAIADAEVELAVGTKAQSVHVVAEKRNMDAVAGGQRFFHVSVAGPLGVLQEPEIGDAGVPDLAAPRQHAGADAGSGALESAGKHGRLVGLAAAGAV